MLLTLICLFGFFVLCIFLTISVFASRGPAIKVSLSVAVLVFWYVLFTPVEAVR